MLSNQAILSIIILFIIAFSNLRAYWLFYRDKKFARTNQYRIPERRLLKASFLLGGIGAFIAMRVVRHKTMHLKFRILVPLAAIFTAAVIVTVVWWAIPFILV